MLTKTLETVFGKRVTSKTSTLRTVEEPRRSQRINPSINVPLLIVEETQYELDEVRSKIRYHAQQYQMYKQMEKHLEMVLEAGTALHTIQENEKVRIREQHTPSKTRS